MKKRAAMLILLLLALSAAAVADTNVSAGDTVPDFAFTTIDGDARTLYGVLAEKNFVLLNLFATWCGPCGEEFPFIESQYESRSDRIEVIAVSGYPGDDVRALDAFRAEHGLTFPICRIADTGVEGFLSFDYYPTSLLIGRDGRICFCAESPFPGESVLSGIFDHVLSADYDGSPFALYGLYVIDRYRNPLPGVTVTYTSDSAVHTCVSGEDGMLVLASEPSEYEIRIVGVPDGYTLEDHDPFPVGAEGGFYVLSLAQ